MDQVHYEMTHETSKQHYYDIKKGNMSTYNFGMLEVFIEKDFDILE